MFIVPKRDVIILDSNLPDADSNYTQFVTGTSYALGVEVQYGQDIFRSLAANNTELPIAQTTTLKWKFLQKANKWAPFDEFNNTKATHPTKIMYVVESRYVDLIGIMRLKANNIKLELFKITDDITTAIPLWEYEEKLFYRNCYNYTEYITKDGVYKKTFLKEIFPYFATKLKIEITGINVEVGNIIYNKKIDLGMVLTSGMVEESGSLIDVELDTTTGYIKQTPIIPRKDLTIPVLIETKDYERATNILDEQLGKACLFVALIRIENVRPNIAIYGFYKNIRSPIGAENCEYELSIKGIV